ncbi:MAG: RNA polymerase II transcription factor B subunit 4 [Peltula sp. TS41687]|nr:MAG: RNA polymerase II transcription factor B subunit 4 [Peltula sp. TS41687]
MNAVDGSEHYERHSDKPPPSLLTIILDTSPLAWSALTETLPLSKAIANILVFINAHLAFNYANQVAVIASHCTEARWLYPSPATTTPQNGTRPSNDDDEDIEMTDGVSTTTTNGTSCPRHDQRRSTNTNNDADKYRPFRLVEDNVLSNLQALIDSTSEPDVAQTNATMMAGALTLALAFINKQTLAYAETNGVAGGGGGAGGGSGTNDMMAVESKDAVDEEMQGLQSRILIVSVSDDLAFQYIPVMNCIFAAQRKRIPIDVLKLASATTFLQQASDATRGIYMHLQSPRGILQYLMMAFLPDQTARRHLILPTQVNVDFRAACFCHKKVVDIGFVCSICLSIFCEPPPGAECLTCGTHLRLGDYGAKPAVVPPRKQKKKRKRLPTAAMGGGGDGTPTPIAESPLAAD